MATLKTQTLPTGILKLTKLLKHLNKPPNLAFTSNVKSLTLSLAYANDHWGARHFVEEDLPRIRYHNPDIEIDVIRWRKEKNDNWRPELEVRFDNAHVKVVDMDAKASSTILKEVMAIAGGDLWKTHVQEAITAGTPVVPDEPSKAEPPTRTKSDKSWPNLHQFREANPHREKKMELARKQREEKKAQNKKGDKRETKTEEMADQSLPTPSDSSTTAPTTT